MPAEKSWDSRMMVEKPVRITAACISRMMPSTRARITSWVMTSGAPVLIPPAP